MKKTDIEKLRLKHQAEIEEATKENELADIMPETTAEQSVFFHRLYGVSGNISLKEGHFGKQWATMADCLAMAAAFPSLRKIKTQGDYTSTLCEECEGEYPHKITERTEVCDVSFRSEGVLQSNYVNANWFSCVGIYIMKISIALNPSWGFRLNYRAKEIPGRMHVETSPPTVWTPDTHTKTTVRFWGTGEHPHSHEVWMHGAPMTALEYFQKLADKIKK